MAETKNKPTTKQSKKGKKLTPKKELPKTQTLMTRF